MNDICGALNHQHNALWMASTRVYPLTVLLRDLWNQLTVAEEILMLSVFDRL